MESISTDNSFVNVKPFKRRNSLNIPRSLSNNIKIISKKYRSNSFTKKISDISGYLINKKTSSISLKKSSRKDIYGNIIEKGGKHKISFRDNIKGNLLVEMTLIDIKQNCLRGKNYKNLTIFREARDKEDMFCSGVCNIF